MRMNYFIALSLILTLSACAETRQTQTNTTTTETWSATSQSISSGMFYDFTDVPNSSLGDNMKNLEPGAYGLYSGDISNNANQAVQDGIINESELGRVFTPGGAHTCPIRLTVNSKNPKTRNKYFIIISLLSNTCCRI